MKTTKSKKSWGQMSAAELAQATRQFDRPSPPGQFNELSKAQSAKFARAGKAGQRGRELIAALGLDPKLLTLAEAYAKRKRLTLNQLVERGLRRELAVQD